MLLDLFGRAAVGKKCYSNSVHVIPLSLGCAEDFNLAAQRPQIPLSINMRNQLSKKFLWKKIGARPPMSIMVVTQSTAADQFLCESLPFRHDFFRARKNRIRHVNISTLFNVSTLGFSFAAR
jgi:hypothetical protein